MEKNVHVYAYPNADVYCDVNIERNGDYQRLAMVYPNTNEFGCLTGGCKVSYEKFLLDHASDYKETIKKLKAIEKDASYSLSPRCECEYEEMKKSGTTWENGHYYNKDGVECSR